MAEYDEPCPQCGGAQKVLDGITYCYCNQPRPPIRGAEEEVAPEATDWELTEELIQRLPILPQRQDSSTNQLNDLVAVANRLGMYDAADYLIRNLKER